MLRQRGYPLTKAMQTLLMAGGFMKQKKMSVIQDHSVWKPLMALLQNASDDILSVASSTLCNLLLEFSPSKEPILESGAVDLLCTLTKRPDPALRLNGIWALMVWPHSLQYSSTLVFQHL